MTTTSPIRPDTAARYETAADWVRSFGDIPLERIIFDPWPATATEDALLHKVEVEKRLCELVDGTLVEKPMGWKESLIAARLIKALSIFADDRRLGFVTGEAGMFRLSRGLIRIPDVAFVPSDHLPGGVLPDEPIPSLVPDLAIEVLSKGNTSAEMERKLSEYFRAGVRVVWLVNPADRSAVIYTASDAGERIATAGTLKGSGPLTGFEMPLALLFEGL